MNTHSIVQKLWNCSKVLCEDGMTYDQYAEQLTYLLYPKLADERSRPPYNRSGPVPQFHTWSSLIKKDGDELFDRYRHSVESMGNERGLFRLQMFSK